jgi:hypothetical protein
MIKCKLCGNDSICLIQTPYAFKLWSQELQAMGIEMRLNTQKIELPPKRTIEEGDEQDDDMIFGGDGIVSLSDRYNHSGGTIKPLEGTEGEGSEVGEDGEGEGQALNGNGDDDSDGEGQALNGNGNDDSDGDGEGQALNGNGDDDSDSDGEGQALNGNGDDDSDSDSFGDGEGFDDSDGFDEGEDDGEQDGHTGGVSKEDIKIVQLDI